MSDQPPPKMPPEVPVRIRWGVFDREVVLDATLSTGPVEGQAFVPVLRQLVDEVIAATLAILEEGGKRPSCASGCTACCHYLVALSEIEAHAIADLIAALPEPRREQVGQRFADAERRLAQSWPLDEVIARLNHPDQRSDLSDDYLRLRIACPFLEDGACSIYEARPLICREYLVSSPAERCWNAADAAHGIEVVPVGRISAGAIRLTDHAPGTTGRRIPLALLPHWLAGDVERPEKRSGLTWFSQFMFAMASIRKEADQGGPAVAQDTAEASPAPEKPANPAT